MVDSPRTVSQMVDSLHGFLMNRLRLGLRFKITYVRKVSTIYNQSKLGQCIGGSLKHAKPEAGCHRVSGRGGEGGGEGGERGGEGCTINNYCA